METGLNNSSTPAPTPLHAPPALGPPGFQHPWPPSRKAGKLLSFTCKAQTLPVLHQGPQLGLPDFADPASDPGPSLGCPLSVPPGSFTPELWSGLPESEMFPGHLWFSSLPVS